MLSGKQVLLGGIETFGRDDAFVTQPFRAAVVHRRFVKARFAFPQGFLGFRTSRPFRLPLQLEEKSRLFNLIPTPDGQLLKLAGDRGRDVNELSLAVT